MECEGGREEGGGDPVQRGEGEEGGQGGEGDDPIQRADTDGQGLLQHSEDRGRGEQFFPSGTQSSEQLVEKTAEEP